MTSGRLTYLARASFEAARSIASVPPEHRLARLHGHHFCVGVKTPAAPHEETANPPVLLSERIAPLDFSLLNEHLGKNPLDESIARWVRQQMNHLPILAVEARSTPDSGVVIDLSDNIQAWRRYRFEAAHRLPNVPSGHQCGRMHGHGFEVVLRAEAQEPAALTQDALDDLWLPLRNALDHACLNDIPGLENPTSEQLAAWVMHRLQGSTPTVNRVSVYETATAGCHYDGTHYRIWKDFRFESATRLVQAPPGDPRRRLHGHSYLLRLRLTAPLDTVLGWTIDYGDVKALFKDVYAALDHHRLDELPGIEDGDLSSIVRWIAARMTSRLPALDRLSLFEGWERGVQLDLGSA